CLISFCILSNLKVTQIYVTFKLLNKFFRKIFLPGRIGEEATFVLAAMFKQLIHTPIFCW
ncbi:MAG TPA: hypothetical protein VGG71_13850, partial [Chitinophagaceae bacterium]